MVVSSYRELIVWQKAMDLVTEIYRTTKYFPKDEQYGLISQMRRCAVSIPSNIAEGKNRGSKNEFRHFLYISYGSGGELETQIEIAKRMNLIEPIKFENIDKLLSEVMRMLNVMIKKLGATISYKL